MTHPGHGPVVHPGTSVPGMSPFLRRALGGITAAAMVTTLMSAAAVQAREPDRAPDTGPATIVVTARSARPNHFNSSIKVDVPAGGNALIGSPSVPKDMTVAKVEVSAPLSDHPAFKLMAFVLFQLPTPGKRLVGCLTLTAQILDGPVDPSDAEGDAATAALALINYCIHLAQLVAQVIAESQGAHPARLASGACPVLPLGVKTKTQKVDGQFHITSDGPLTIKNKNTKLKVKCVAKANKYIYTVKPRKKGKTLKSVVGKNLQVGIASPAGAEAGAEVKVAFKAP